MSPQPPKRVALQALKTTAGNIASLGPAGALGPSWWPHWLEEVRAAIRVLEAELEAPPDAYKSHNRIGTKR